MFKNHPAKGRSVAICMKKSLSLLAVSAIAVAGFLFPAQVKAFENTTPIVAVAVGDYAMRTNETTRRVNEATPLVAVPVTPTGTELPESYVNDYLGFTRTDLVRYLVNHADDYLSTPYTYNSLANPVTGPEGGMQCESFVWHAMFQVAMRNRADVPCGSALTEPLGNGGGWVDWAYYHGIEPLEFATKEEMLDSGVLEKGDIIWSFDAAGPYGLSSNNHVGFFWGNTPREDKLWHTAKETGDPVFAGKDGGNRITRIESLSTNPSVWWVFKLSPDASYRAADWAGKPAVSARPVASPAAREADQGEEAASEDAGEEEDLVSEGASAEAAAPKEKEIVFFEG